MQSNKRLHQTIELYATKLNIDDQIVSLPCEEAEENCLQTMYPASPTDNEQNKS